MYVYLLFLFIRAFRDGADLATLIVKPYLTVSTNYFYLIFIFIKILKLDMEVALYLL